MLTEAIVGHLVGDYLVQTDWMALNKKQSTLHCLVHCSIWTACVCVFSGLGWTAAAILFGTHFLQDRTTIVEKWMDFIGQSKFRVGPCAPWSGIVVDNVFHILTIFVVIKTLG